MAARKRRQKKETQVKVAVGIASVVTRRRHGPATSSPRVLPEVPSTVLLRTLFSLQQPSQNIFPYIHPKKEVLTSEYRILFGIQR